VVESDGGHGVFRGPIEDGQLVDGDGVQRSGQEGCRSAALAFRHSPELCEAGLAGRGQVDRRDAHADRAHALGGQIASLDRGLHRQHIQFISGRVDHDPLIGTFWCP
jgi:hypothetical protein